MIWPDALLSGARVAELVAEAQALQARAEAGEPVEAERAVEIVLTLGAYVESLPEARRAEVSRALVAETTRRPRFTPGVMPRGVRRRGAEAANTHVAAPIEIVAQRGVERP
ncbi:MAG TPA: hypothetical protein VNP94_02690 [Actinomycetota bacterium]|nr:hypothetical protein [Actinomycetota bacterium]